MTAPTKTEAKARADVAPGSRLFAAVYDPLVGWAERAGMADHRKRLLHDVQGDTLELGAGTGLNLAHYPDQLGRLVLAEPEPNMARHLEHRIARLGRVVELVRAPAEVLPFEDGTFETVVCTLVLCTVQDPSRSGRDPPGAASRREAPLFLEHVRADEARLARWQERLHGPWQFFAGGCNCNRSTIAAIRDAGFTVRVTEHAQWRRMPPIVRPLASGHAIPVDQAG